MIQCMIQYRVYSLSVSKQCTVTNVLYDTEGDSVQRTEYTVKSVCLQRVTNVLYDTEGDISRSGFTLHA